MEKERYYTENEGPIAEIEMLAFKKAVELSKEIENIQQITILMQKTGIVYHPQRINVSIARRVKVNHLERVKVNH